MASEQARLPASPQRTRSSPLAGPACETKHPIGGHREAETTLTYFTSRLAEGIRLTGFFSYRTNVHEVGAGDPADLAARIECSSDYSQTGCERSLVHQGEKINACTSQEDLGRLASHTYTRSWP